MSDDVVRNDTTHRYELDDDEGRVIAFTEVHRYGTVVDMPHTVVDERVRGQGLAGRVVAAALVDIGAAGCTVRPTCSYVQHYIESHEQFRSLVAHDGPITGR